MEAAQSLEEASRGKEFDGAYQSAEKAMLAVTTTHERLSEHLALHDGQEKPDEKT